MLDWTQDDLASESHISISTIRTIELGKTPRTSTINEIREAFEQRGVEFTDCDGVKSRVMGVRALKGADSCDILFAEVAEVSGRSDVDVLLAVKSQDILTKKCGAEHLSNIERLTDIQKSTDVKCLLINIAKPSFARPSFICRAATVPLLGCAGYVIYGDKYAQIVSENFHNFMIVVFDVPLWGEKNRKEFMNIWPTSHSVEF